MTETEELRLTLDERDVEYTTDDGTYISATTWQFDGGRFATFVEDDKGNTAFAFDSSGVTPERAIAATLEAEQGPLDELLRCLENDYGIRAEWDELRKVWRTTRVEVVDE